MKVRVTNYSFNAATRKVIFSGYASISLEAILLITNTTSNIIIYNFADQSRGGSVSGNELTLIYNTSSMSDSDKLQIFYDDDSIEPATDAKLEALEEQSQLLKRLLHLTSALGTVDTKQQLRVNVATFDASTIRQTASDGNYVYEINSVVPLGRFYTVPDFWRCVELARQSYNNGIRSNLTFS